MEREPGYYPLSVAGVKYVWKLFHTSQLRDASEAEGIFSKHMLHFHHLYPSLCVYDHGWVSFIDSEKEKFISPVRISRN
jgi:hypothetical protein